ncbi:hypothetical protein EV189_0433 [Motilibacter rhizosphaerae]|uniref:PBP domain-containing protein n=1 Tax=Motilibacter rhizosphaerae TaxID=598652 RepID=A0A4V2F511_9ACTN|nr:hypothetical protein [Motilibacter rhizosphaerae]RZS91199.1 hypothetical protein EV189_0433 [Motilibacter rhizosphaerae]
MKLVARTVLALVAGVVAVPTAMAVTGVANADPDTSSSAYPYALNGGGSDTTEELMTDIANNVKVGGVPVIGNWSAKGGAFDTNGSAAGCSYAGNAGVAAGAGIRPDGSGAGRDRLEEAMDPSNAYFGCLDFARSSSGSTKADQTKLALAVDTLTYAVRSDSGLSKKFTLAQLQSIYQCKVPTIHPLLPQAGSGSRSVWENLMGITDAALPACINDKIQENDGTSLGTDKFAVMPYSSSQWAAQTAGVISDVHGVSALGAINSIPGLASNGAGAGVRTVYNVVSTARLNSSSPDDALLQQVFKGPNSLVCAQTASIGRQGFLPTASCGSN